MNDITKNALRLVDYALENNITGNLGELCDAIGLQTSGMSRIRNDERSFTHEQLQALARVTNADMNWIYGFGRTMFRVTKAEKPMVRIRQALAEIEAQLAIKPLTQPLTPGAKKRKK